MGYGQAHDIPRKTEVQEAIIGQFSWGQLKWLVPAMLLTGWMITNVPPLPIDSSIYSRIPHVSPMIIAVVFINFKHPKTNLSLAEYLKVMVAFKRRQRTFIYHRQRLSNRLINLRK